MSSDSSTSTSNLVDNAVGWSLEYEDPAFLSGLLCMCETKPMFMPFLFYTTDEEVPKVRGDLFRGKQGVIAHTVLVYGKT